MSESPTPSQPKSRWLIENVISLAFALVIVFMIRSSIVEAFKIPSGSMIPTLHIGDYIFVNKFAYGFKIPFSDLVTDPIYVIKRDAPKRGDIIVFLYPKDESFHYIKRVVGVPGDTIELRNKVIYINQKPIERDTVAGDSTIPVFDSLDDPRYTPENLDAFKEHLDGVDHFILQDKKNYMNESFGPVTVPAESLFVMGDNRDFSNDSRFWGFVPFKNVKGKAMVIWMSLWFNLPDAKVSFHPGRIGTILK